jgi:hypothetical protein
MAASVLTARILSTVNVISESIDAAQSVISRMTFMTTHHKRVGQEEVLFYNLTEPAQGNVQRMYLFDTSQVCVPLLVPALFGWELLL